MRRWTDPPSVVRLFNGRNHLVSYKEALDTWRLPVFSPNSSFLGGSSLVCQTRLARKKLLVDLPTGIFERKSHSDSDNHCYFVYSPKPHWYFSLSTSFTLGFRLLERFPRRHLKSGGWSPQSSSLWRFLFSFSLCLFSRLSKLKCFLSAPSNWSSMISCFPGFQSSLFSFLQSNSWTGSARIKVQILSWVVLCSLILTASSYHSFKVLCHFV